MKRKISDIMSQPAVSVDLDDNIESIIQIIDKYKFDHVPVTEGGSTLKGIVSKSDLYRKLISLSLTTAGKTFSQKILTTTKAREVMTPNPVKLSSTQDADLAIEVLLQGDFHAIPIVDNDRLVGMVTSKDILEFMVDHNNEKL